MLANRDGRPTAYELLAVHPNAPADLIATTYWVLVGLLQKRRERGEYVDGALHELTRAYECISDPERRAAHDASVGHTLEPLAKRPLPRLRRSLRSRLLHRDVVTGPLDHYEVLGVTPAIPPEALQTAYQIMLNQYLRVPPGNKKRTFLLMALDDAYATLSNPEAREKYDRRVTPKTDTTEQLQAVGNPPAVERPLPAVQAPDLPAENPGLHQPVPAVRQGFGRVVAAGVRFPYRGARAALRARQPASRPAGRERRVKSPPAPEPPIMREPPPRPRAASLDVEEALLGRIAAYAREMSPHPSAESRDGRLDGPHSSQP